MWHYNRDNRVIKSGSSSKEWIFTSYNHDITNSSWATIMTSLPNVCTVHIFWDLVGKNETGRKNPQITADPCPSPDICTIHILYSGICNMHAWMCLSYLYCTSQPWVRSRLSRSETQLFCCMYINSILFPPIL